MLYASSLVPLSLGSLGRLPLLCLSHVSRGGLADLACRRERVALLAGCLAEELVLLGEPPEGEGNAHTRAEGLVGRLEPSLVAEVLVVRWVEDVDGVASEPVTYRECEGW